MGFWSKLFSPSSAGVRETYGFTAEDPVLCYKPLGEVEFLDSLRCPDGHLIRGQRLGSMGGTCTDLKGHDNPREELASSCIVDCYECACDGGKYTCTLYFDMYHPPCRQPACTLRIESRRRARMKRTRCSLASPESVSQERPAQRLPPMARR